MTARVMVRASKQAVRLKVCTIMSAQNFVSKNVSNNKGKYIPWKAACSKICRGEGRSRSRRELVEGRAIDRIRPCEGLLRQFESGSKVLAG